MKIYSTVLALIALSCAHADGQVRTARKEKATDRIEIRVSKAQLNRDIKERADFRVKTAEFESRYAAGDEQRLHVLHTELVEAMQREIEQSEKKTFSDKLDKKHNVLNEDQLVEAGSGSRSEVQEALAYAVSEGWLTPESCKKYVYYRMTKRGYRRAIVLADN